MKGVDGVELGMEECEQMDKSLRDLIEIIHFTENVSVKIHGVLDEADIYRAVMKEFVKSKRYNVSIVLLTDDGSKLRIAGASLTPKKLKNGENMSGLRLKDYRIKLNKSSIYSQVVREGKTIQVNSRDIMGELFSRPLVYLLSKVIDFKNEKSIVTPLNLHGKIIGSLTMSSTDLAELFIPSVKNLAQHISTALEMADERAEYKKAEEKFKNIFESANDAMIYLDRSGRILDVNRKAVEVFGGSKKELVEKHFTKVGVFSPRDIPTLMTAFAKSIAGKPATLNVRIKNKKGQEIFLEGSASVMNVDDKVAKLVIARDVTERKKMAEKLKHYSEHLEELIQKRTEELLESEKRYSVLVEEASDGVAILQDEKIAFVNKKVSEITGYSRDELIGSSFKKIVKMVDQKYHQLIEERHKRRMQGEKVPETSEMEMIAKTGECVPIEASSTLTQYQGRPATLTIVRDIRERKRMEEERSKLEKLATIGEVATMVGHDLRNPLQSIEIATYYLNNELTGLTPSVESVHPQKVKEMLQVINDSVNYADKIVRDLRDFSATGKTPLTKTSINTIVKETLLQVETPENVKLITKLSHLPKIKADKDLIKRVFLNLVINGIQAMEKGGTLKVSTKKTKGFVEVSFKDTGVGMSKENMKKIFTPFFTRKAKGMGVGLAICKRLVDSHGGSIDVESEEGKGSTFTVNLPIK